MSAKTRSGVAVLVGLALAAVVGFVSPPTAVADGSYSWQTATDAQVASFVTAPNTSLQWAGIAAAAGSIYSFQTAGYNAFAAGDISTGVEDTAIQVGFDIDPWALAESIAIGATASFIGYETSSLYYTWSSTQWGDNSGGL